MGRTAIIRIDTNQGIYGLGEVRDGADERYALMLKSRILGQNPCNVEMIFKSIKQFGGQGRQAGGVCGVEMALWDICGKAYNVPGWQLLGGRYRDKIRMYADTPEAPSPEEQKKLIKYRTRRTGIYLVKNGCFNRRIKRIRAHWSIINSGKMHRGILHNGAIRVIIWLMEIHYILLHKYRSPTKAWRNCKILLKMYEVWLDMKFHFLPIIMVILI